MKTTTKPPYAYFDGRPDKFNEFTELCFKRCVFGGPSTKCNILDVLTNSIIHDDERWEEGWVGMDKGFPVCLKRKEHDV